MLTSVMWTLGHMHHEQDLHWLECESDCKKWFPPHLAMCRTFWWKSGPNNCAWLTSWWKSVFVVVFQLRTTFILTKHNFHLIKSKGTRATNFKTYQNDQWKGFIGFQTVQICPRWFFIVKFFTSSWGDKFLEMFHLIVICISIYSPCKNSKTRVWGMYAVSIAYLF